MGVRARRNAQRAHTHRETILLPSSLLLYLNINYLYHSSKTYVQWQIRFMHIA
jgi:hypothetical protein